MFNTATLKKTSGILKEKKKENVSKHFLFLKFNRYVLPSCGPACKRVCLVNKSAVFRKHFIYLLIANF